MKRIYAIISFALLAWMQVSADDMFRSITDSIIANNTALASRRAALESETMKLQADNNLNDPEVEFEHQWGQDNIGNKWAVSVSQSFDWPGLYRRRSAAARAGADAFSMLYKSEEADLRLRVTNTLIDYVAAREKLAMSNAVKQNLDSIYGFIRKAYDRSDATVLDMKKISLEHAEAIARLDDAQLAVDNLRHELIALNGGKYIDLAEVTGYPLMKLYDEDHYAAAIEAADPALAAVAGEAETARLTAAAERLRSMPGFSLGYIHNVELGDHFNGITAGVSLPFFSGRKRAAAARAEAISADYRMADYRITAQNRLRADYAAARSYERRLKSYDGMFGDGDNYLQLLYKSFMGGQMTFVTYLYEINYYIEARSAYIDLLHDYNLSLASLNRFE